MDKPPHSIPVVILAGGRAKPELEAVIGVPNRALAKLGDHRLIDYVVSALRASSWIGEIWVVGDFEPPKGCKSVSDHGGFVENVLAGVAAAASAGNPVLIATCDIPYLTSVSLEDFVSRAVTAEKEIAYVVASADLCSKRFPGIKRTAVNLKEGSLTGGNLMLVGSSFLASHADAIRTAYSLRKSPLKLAAKLGPSIILRLVGSALGVRSVLTIPILERAVGNMLGASVSAIVSEHAEVATDLDRPEDFRIAETLPLPTLSENQYMEPP